MKVDYMKPSPWKKVQIVDKTKTKLGVPTATAMQRLLDKTMKNV